MDHKELANLIFPNIKDRSYYEEKYPERKLKEGAMVVRFAPSPTGFVHIGGIYTSVICSKLAKQTDGVFMLRIEDTDQKREVENGVDGIIDALKKFNLVPDEGMINEEDGKGEYGPYKQSQRKEIYQSFAKKLIEEKLAYPCFCTGDDLTSMREKQENAKLRPGYYGAWATCRNLGLDEAERRIKNGDEYIIRFKSQGNPEKKIKHHDVIKGNVDFPENDQDIVIIKSDGLPTYHFAHAVDDYLMRTTHVIRGDEWLSSLPVHIQLFQALGVKPTKYAHIAPIMKEEDGAKRKLSKRKDPEAAVEYYAKVGIPSDAAKEYLLNIANSNFEQWRKQNKMQSIDEFELSLNKMSVSGALFDMVKLLDISKTVISRYTKEEVYDKAFTWASEYDDELKELLEKDKEYTLKVLGIERGNEKPRKDISKWSDVKENISYMYDDIFLNSNIKYEYQNINEPNEIKKIITAYVEKYFDLSDDKQTWFNKMKDLAEEFGYAREVKEYKQNPDSYKGHVGDISTVIRIALTGRANTPDMYEIMQVLGKESIDTRLKKAVEEQFAK